VPLNVSRQWTARTRGANKVWVQQIRVSDWNRWNALAMSPIWYIGVVVRDRTVR